MVHLHKLFNNNKKKKKDNLGSRSILSSDPLRLGLLPETKKPFLCAGQMC